MSESPPSKNRVSLTSLSSEVGFSVRYMGVAIIGSSLSCVVNLPTQRCASGRSSIQSTPQRGPPRLRPVDSDPSDLRFPAQTLPAHNLSGIFDPVQSPTFSPTAALVSDP